MSEYVGFGWRDRNAKKVSGRAPDPLNGSSAGGLFPPLSQNGIGTNLLHVSHCSCSHSPAAVKNAMTWHAVGGGSSSAMSSRMFPRANVCVQYLQLIVYHRVLTGAASELYLCVIKGFRE